MSLGSGRSAVGAGEQRADPGADRFGRRPVSGAQAGQRGWEDPVLFLEDVLAQESQCLVW